MWARWVELVLALWLAVSGFVFSYEEPILLWHLNELFCAFLFALFALLSFHPRFSRAHLLHIIPICWMVVLNYIHGYPLPPFLQNDQVLAFVYLTLFIIPSHCNLPPKSWQDFRQN